MVDLTAAPFNLDADAVAWVESTIAGMSDEEKIGQLFVNMGSSRDPEYLKGVLEEFHIAAVRYNPGNADEVYEQNKVLQENSKILMLIAVNTEAGGNGACKDGTYIGWEAKIAATNNKDFAYELGRISGIEAAAIGCNWSFAPIVDINRNWRNPIISRRTWGADPDQVLEYSLEYMRGIKESGIAPAAKHFPGDGIDERDQHLSSAPNWLSTDEWDETFGKVWQGLIDAGLPSLMAGHIGLPSHQKHFNPGMTDADILPATLSKELLTDLLRGKLGFNGVVVTDASHMVGMTGVMARRDLLPQAIEAGCDLFLFLNDSEEDFTWMMEGWKSGKLSDERLHEALTRTLGLKAMLGLHTKEKTAILQPKEEAMAKIGVPEHQAVAERVADAGITLVKNQQDVLPISPEKTKRVLVVPVGGAPNPMAVAMHGGGHPADKVVEMLNARGYEATRYQTILDKTQGKTAEEVAEVAMGAYAGKLPISALTDNFDLVITAAEVDGLMQPVERAYWPASKGTYDIPWYVHEIPTIVVSFATPHMLPDVPQVKTYSNAYDSKDVTLTAVLDKLEGKGEFRAPRPPMCSPAWPTPTAEERHDRHHPPMAQPLVDFTPTKEYFVGIDSDGCAMDAMDIKHYECFTPNYIKHWDLQPISTLARETAIFVNLHSVTRGLNRWLALKQLLDLLRDRAEVAERGVVIPEYPELTEFIESDYPLSDKGIAAFAEAHPSETIDRAIRWGNGVNATIADMVHGCGPFPGVREAMAAMHDRVDDMTVSATPLEALNREWTEHGLAEYMQVIAGQEMGSKAQHVQYAATGKYDADKIMLIGDAPGDRDAARKAGCLYYPIIPGEEKQSWARVTAEALLRFLDGTYVGEYQDGLVAEFERHLPDVVPWPTVSGITKVSMPQVKS